MFAQRPQGLGAFDDLREVLAGKTLENAPRVPTSAASASYAFRVSGRMWRSARPLATIGKTTARRDHSFLFMRTSKLEVRRENKPNKNKVSRRRRAAISGGSTGISYHGTPSAITDTWAPKNAQTATIVLLRFLGTRPTNALVHFQHARAEAHERFGRKVVVGSVGPTAAGSRTNRKTSAPRR